jgi:hypothetical protein
VDIISYNVLDHVKDYCCVQEENPIVSSLETRTNHFSSKLKQHYVTYFVKLDPGSLHFPILLVELCDPNREGSVHPQINFSLRNRRAKKSYSISASILTNFERDDYSNQVSICKLFTFKCAVPAIHGRTGKKPLECLGFASPCFLYRYSVFTSLAGISRGLQFKNSSE